MHKSLLAALAALLLHGAASLAAEPPKPVLPASGAIRFVIVKESLGLQIGRAEHRWQFAADGAYVLHGETETSGLAALIRRIRTVQESRGRLVAGGLRPESFRSRREDKGSEEGADFDWDAGQVRLLHDGLAQPLTPGTQDILSLNYQLPYLGHLAGGMKLGVVMEKRYRQKTLDSLGEEEIEVPAGRFRALHLRAVSGDSTTEIWAALDRAYLPVKIRFTDKKGDSYEQVATDFEY